MKKIRKNTFSVLVAALSIVLALITVVYAVVLFSFRVDGKIDGNTDTINSEELLNLEVTETSVSFAKAGEEGRKNISLTVKNDTNVNIAYSFGLSADNNSLTESQFSVLTGAVLVYFDGNFEGTLSSLIQNGEKIIDNGYVMAKGDKTRTQSHVLSLELHIATEQSLLGKEFGVRVTTYSRNANYANTILVSDETGFLRAADDINSGLLSSPENGKTAEKITIALADDITLNILYQKYYEAKASTENNYSVCFLLTQGNNNYLFTGDLEKSGEESLVASNNLPKVKLYKAGHHGSKTSSNTALMSVIQPEIVCVCCCAGSSEFNAAPLNTFPTQDFINRVAPYTDKIYVTSLSVSYSGNQTVSMNGNITVSSLGKEVTVTCSYNDVILKETDLFKANRSWPTNGV